ncbi:MAG: hypothetical protein DMF63_03170 [Acidobacteria bacterium]|nr:MAG: hypothetical protein DMF63_03170 [Acidobacteriota bacterium]
MKRFIVSVLFVTVFCIGLGALVDKAGAKFKSDEKALALIKQARLAIGGDQSIADVRSMVIKGNTSLTLRMKDGARTETGETEIAMQLPDKFSKMLKIGHPDGNEGSAKVVSDVVIMHRTGEGHGEAMAGAAGEKMIVIKKVGENGENVEIEKVVPDGKDAEWNTVDDKKVMLRTKTAGDTEGVIVDDNGGQRKHVMLERTGPAGETGHRQNELLRTTLSLLLSAPEGMDVSYTFAGEGDVDSTPCNIVNAEVAGSNIKLFLSKTSNLPLMISYSGHAMPNVMFFRTKEPAAGEPAKDNVMFTRKVDAPEMAEIQVRFADYRSVNGVQLPYKWTTSVAGQTTEAFDVTGYDVNPANIAEKFQNQKVFVRTAKPGQ